jgi:hypothetical protein
MYTSLTPLANSRGSQYERQDFADMKRIWLQLEECYAGEHMIKQARERYLPRPSSMGSAGENRDADCAYDAYINRAGYDNYIAMAIQTYLGMLHAQPAVIELPEKMLPLNKNCSNKGESLQALIIRATREQLLYGRFGLLVDIPSGRLGKEVLPYIATYGAKSIVSWDDSLEDVTANKLNMVILDESGWRRAGITGWEHESAFRILHLGDLSAQGQAEGTYSVRVTATEALDSKDIVPSYMGKTLNEIPFVFINSADNLPELSYPPLLELSNKTLLIYRGEADYRLNLYQQGQDTLVVIGSTDDEKALQVGAGAAIFLPQGADAKFVGVNSTGLSEQRIALENLKHEAANLAGQMLDNKARVKESGDALSMRVGTKTASLLSIAKSAAAGVEQALKIIARWIGEDENKVKVTPNLDFNNSGMGTRELVDLMTAKQMGAPISTESIHALMRRYGITEQEYSEEEKLLNSEEPLLMGNTNLNRAGMNAPKDPTTFKKGN